MPVRPHSLYKATAIIPARNLTRGYVTHEYGTRTYAHSQNTESATPTACNLPHAICRYSGFGFENTCSHLYV